MTFFALNATVAYVPVKSVALQLTIHFDMQAKVKFS